MDRNNYYGGESASLNLNQVRLGSCLCLAVTWHMCWELRIAKCLSVASHPSCSSNSPWSIRMQLWERFRAGQKPPESLGASRDFNVDMVPKFIMANGNLVKVPLCSCVRSRPVSCSDVRHHQHHQRQQHAAAAPARKLSATHSGGLTMERLAIRCW
jgi:RAB protein geranylgeranyltransferase component A